MEQAIINRVKWLIAYDSSLDLTECVKQAIKEFGDVEELSKTYAMFEITFEDYVESIKRKINQ